jgi:hypothetical protein
MVDGPGVKREGANNLLEPVCLLGVHGLGIVNLGHLDFAALLGGIHCNGAWQCCFGVACWYLWRAAVT